MKGLPASDLVVITTGDFLKVLYDCGGYYECPRRADGTRLGPLVGYAGTYGDENQHYVGDVYYNCAMIEEFPHALDFLAEQLAGLVYDASFAVDCILGAPMGGIAFALALARALDRRFIFAEKQVIMPASDGRREESVLALSRHEVFSGASVLLVEDVCNNFSTTLKVKELVESCGASLVGVACELNRSPHKAWEGLPVYSSAHIPTQQYQQDDPAVAADVAAGNIVWKPKNGWGQLMAVMAAKW